MRIGLIQALVVVLPSVRFAAGSSAIKDGLMAAVLSARCRSPSPANASGVCFTAQPQRGEPDIVNELMTGDAGRCLMLFWAPECVRGSTHSGARGDRPLLRLHARCGRSAQRGRIPARQPRYPPARSVLRNAASHCAINRLDGGTHGLTRCRGYPPAAIPAWGASPMRTRSGGSAVVVGCASAAPAEAGSSRNSRRVPLSRIV